MLSAWLWLSRRELRDYYPSVWWGGAGEVLTALTSVAIYWFTARAFAGALTPSLRSFGFDYFGYVIIGETFMILPLVLCEGVTRAVRKSAVEGMLEAFLVQPMLPQVSTLLGCLSSATRELGRGALTLGIAVVFFGLRIAPLRLVAALGIAVVSAPVFLGLGMLWAAAVIFLGRGVSALSHFTMLASVLAGVYFPLTVLPHEAAVAVKWLSPFTIYLETVRSLVAPGGPVLVTPLGVLIVTGALLGLGGYFALGAGFHWLRKRGMPLWASV